MKTTIIALGAILIIGILIAIGASLFSVKSFSSNLPRGEGGLITFDGEDFKGVPSTAGLEANSLLISKMDPKIVYLGTIGNGVWVSTDSGETFKKAQDEVLLGKVDVYDMKEDLKGNLYTSIYDYAQNRGSLVFSSFQTGSSEIYFNSLPKFGVFGASLEGGNISIISSDGGFYRSANNGKSWELRSRKNEGLLKMYLVSKKHFVLTSQNTIILSSDSGKSWKDITPLSSGRKKLKVRDFYADQRTGFLIALTDKLLISENSGGSWRDLNLIVPAGALPINSIAMHPSNSNVIYASSENVLYKSADNGITWSLFEVPTKRKISDLFVSQILPNILFLATKL